MRLEKALYKADKKGMYKVRYLLVDDKFNVQEEALFFDNWLEANGYSPNTIEGYLRDLKAFFNFLEYKGLRLNEIKPLHVVAFLDYLKGYKDKDIIDISEENKRRSGATVNRMLAAVSSFYKCLETADITEKSPFVYLDGVRPTGMYKSFLSYTQNGRKTNKKFVKSRDYKNFSAERLFPNEVAQFTEGMASFRNKLMVDILYETGIRIGELLGLQIDDYSDIDSTKKFGYIYIVDRDNEDKDRRQKTGSRTLAVTMNLLYKIDEYIIQHRPYIEGSNLIFVSEKGKNKGLKLTRNGIEDIFKKCTIKTGIRCHPHLLRHTHFTELAEAGFDELFIQIRAGHSNASSTSKYKHPSLQVQSQAFMRFIDYREGLKNGKN